MKLNVLYKLITLSLGFLTVPILLDYLGEFNYGVWITIGSFLGFFQLFDIGLAQGLRIRLAKNIYSDNISTGQRTISTTYTFISIVSIGVVILFSITFFFIDYSIIFKLSDDQIIRNLKLVLFINIFFIALNFVLAISNIVLYALQLSSFVDLFRLFIQGMNLIAIIILTRTSNSSLILISLVFGLISFFVNLSINIGIYKINKDLSPKLKLFDKKELKIISSFGIKMFITQIAAFILNSTDNILISFFFGPENVTIYSIPYKIFMYISVFQLAFITPMISSYTVAFEQDNYDFMKNGLNKMIVIFLGFTFCLIALFSIFNEVSFIWLKKSIVYPNNMVLIICFYFIALMWTNIFSSFLYGIGKINVMTITSIIQAILNIPISIILVKYLHFGMTGVIGGSLVVMLIVAVVMPLEVRKELTIIKNRVLTNEE